MKLLELSVRNFLAFGDEENVINLDAQGLVLVSGENKDDKSTHSNGSGKSSLISDGLTYALFGQTMKGLKGNDVINRFTAGPMVVEITFKDDQDTEWKIRRVRSSKKQSVELLQGEHQHTQGTSKSTQIVIDKILGMDFITFACSTIFGQGVLKAFSAMTDSEMKAVFTKMLALEEIHDWRDSAKEHREEISESLRSGESKLSNWRTKLKDAANRLKQLRSERSEWKTKQSEKIEKKLAEISDLESDLSSKDAEANHLKSLEESLSEAQDSVDDYDAALRRRRMMVKDARTAFSEAEFAVRQLEQDGKKTREELDAFLALNERGACDGCYQPISGEHAHATQERLGALLAKQIGERTQLLTRVKTAEADLAKAEKLEKRSAKRLVDVSNEVSNINAAVAKTQAKLDGYVFTEKSLKRAKAELKALRKERFAAGKSINSLKADIPEIKSSIKETKRDLKKLEEEAPYADFWINAFGNAGLRSFILDSVAPFLTKQANSYSKILSGGNIDIEFQTTSMLKSGEMRDNFKVVARNNSGADVYAGASAGERNKIDLCVGLALQDLVRSRTKTSVNVAVFDEATANLDLASAERFIELLDSHLVKAETVFVVTHSDVFKGYFGNELRVVKEGGISKVDFGG